MFVSDNMLCTQYRWTGHFKKECQSWTKTKEKFQTMINRREFRRGFGTASNVKKVRLSGWTKRNLWLHPYLHFWNSNLSWFPKLTNDLIVKESTG